MKEFLKQYLSIAFLGIVLVFPVHSKLFPWHTNLIDFLFKHPVAWIKKSVLNWETNYNEFSSDSSSLFVLVALVLLVTLVFTLLLQKLKLYRNHRPKILNGIRVLLSFYLTYILLVYGFAKVFKAQFYLPEPNILHTKFGNLDQDILYWSTMGTSYVYNLFMGLVEVLVGFLVFFRRTRILGLFLSIGVFANILAVNISYDISVKLFAAILLGLSVFLSWKHLKTMIRGVVLGEKIEFERDENVFKDFRWNAVLSFVFISIFLLDSFYPVLQTGVLNDDKAPRNELHGSYECLESNPLHIDEVYIHRKNYIIFNRGGEMQDFYFYPIKGKNQLLLEDEDGKQTVLTYQKEQDTLKLNVFGLELTCLETNWREMPALQRKFHWFVDE